VTAPPRRTTPPTAKEIPVFTIHRRFLRIGALLAFALAAAPAARADALRNIATGEPVPPFQLPTLDGSTIDSASMAGSVVVVVCLSAEQRRSELAAFDSFHVVQACGDEPVRLVHVTADAIQRAYFEQFRQERGITAPLALDADRTLFGKLGLIVFPTTVVISPDGHLAHVISLHDDSYPRTLDAYIHHALGTIDDAALKERLAAHTEANPSPRSQASAHRGLARSLREKGHLAEAKAELMTAREQDPLNHEVMLDLVDIDIELADLDDADAILAVLLANNPNDIRSKELKGIVLFHRGDADGAQKMLQEALTLNPAPQRIHYYLGRIAEDKGDTVGALAHYREALRRFLHETEAPSESAATKTGE